jgi:hypothetical protein
LRRGGTDTFKTNVFFECTCDDTIGAAWSTAFRDAIPSSPRYEETDVAEHAVIKDSEGKNINTLNWHVVAVTAPAGRNFTAVPFAVLIGYSYVVTSMVQACPDSTTRSCATNAMVFLDGIIHDYNAKHHG